MRLLTVLIFVTTFGVDICCAQAPATVAQATNFVVRSSAADASAADVLAECIALRRKLQAAWFDDQQPSPWRPRCEVVVHSRRASYLAAVGRGGAQTMGSSLTETSRGRIVRRRIDLLVDETGAVPALAHELTHVLLADRFDGGVQRRADEGLALLADTPRKQTLHHRDLAYALRTGTTLRVAELLSFERPAAPEQIGVFYGQSLSLVRFFMTRSDRRRLTSFLVSSQNHGYDRALRDVYHIDGVAHLERLWRRHAEQTPITPIGFARED
jgi:hypothetical protein